MLERPRRNRRSAALRNLTRESSVSAANLIQPLFVVDGRNQRQAIESMPGMERLSIDQLLVDVEKLLQLGVSAAALFPRIEEERKDARGSESLRVDGLYPRAIRALKEAYPQLCLFSDVALDPYSSDGHDGLLSADGRILNDETLPLLAEMALVQAQAGADFVSPSDMMDGRVAFIRKALDNQGYTETGILAYTAKYASAFYGPFRNALESAPRSGDKKTYQMDPANRREALREARLDASEGADILMVKPGLPYLDVIRALAESSDLPIAAYNVSGEYAMLRAAGERGWLNYRAAAMETLQCLRRAGADMILTYHAAEAAAWLREEPY
ncbi:MAG: porphobilinogen synthase [Leptospirales bacterium]|nr:porphobilinogen synthase [Leptospirales bacterium]